MTHASRMQTLDGDAATLGLVGEPDPAQKRRMATKRPEASDEGGEMTATNTADGTPTRMGRVGQDRWGLVRRGLGGDLEKAARKSCRRCGFRPERLHHGRPGGSIHRVG